MNKSKILLTSALVLGLSVSQVNAAAVDEIAEKTVASIGIQTFGTTNQTYFRVTEGWTLAPCAFGVMYFDPTTAIGKTFLATLLTAKASGTKLSRVVYDATVNSASQTICTLDQILELQ